MKQLKSWLDSTNNSKYVVDKYHTKKKHISNKTGTDLVSITAWNQFPTFDPSLRSPNPGLTSLAVNQPGGPVATPESPGVARVSTAVLRVCSKLLGYAQTNGRNSRGMTPFPPRALSKLESFKEIWCVFGCQPERDAASMFGFRLKPACSVLDEISHPTAKIKHENYMSPYLTIKSAKILDICRNYVELSKSVRYWRKICCTSGWGVHCVHPGGPGHPQRSASYTLLCVAKKYHDEHQKSWESLGSMDGHPSNWLSIMGFKLSFNCPWCVVKTYCRHSGNAGVLSLWCLHHEAMSDAELFSSEMVRDWSCKLRRAKV